jgi:hypothetical protein
MSHQVMKEMVFPKVKEGKPLFFIVIDNLRLDQWEMIETQLKDHFNVKEEKTYYSILPTTTAFSRNALFSGMMPIGYGQVSSRTLGRGRYR